MIHQGCAFSKQLTHQAWRDIKLHQAWLLNDGPEWVCRRLKSNRGFPPPPVLWEEGVVDATHALFFFHQRGNRWANGEIKQGFELDLTAQYPAFYTQRLIKAGAL